MKRALITLIALFFGLIGLGMSLCGGGFLFASLMDSTRRRTSELMGIAPIALPSLLIGIALTVVCFGALLKQSQNDPPEEH